MHSVRTRRLLVLVYTHARTHTRCLSARHGRRHAPTIVRLGPSHPRASVDIRLRDASRERIIARRPHSTTRDMGRRRNEFPVDIVLEQEFYDDPAFHAAAPVRATTRSMDRRWGDATRANPIHPRRTND